MASRYDLLYPVTPEEFDLSERRFNRTPVVATLNVQSAIKSNNHSVDDTVIQEVLTRLDQLSLKEFHSPVSHFSNPDLERDLNLEQVVDHLFRPRFTPQFQQRVLSSVPIDLDTTLYRQEGVRELVEKPELAKGLEDAMQLFAELNCSILDRVYTYKNLPFLARRRQKLKILTPYNLKVLQKYTSMIGKFSETLDDTESAPMQRLKQYIRDIEDSDFFMDVSPTFEVSYFKDHRISLDVTIGRNGVPNASEYSGSE